MDQFKYIVHNQSGFSQPVIFCNVVNHADMMRNLGLSKDQVVSAGFLQLTSAGARCYGSSTTLGISSRPEADNALINRMGGDNF